MTSEASLLESAPHPLKFRLVNYAGELLRRSGLRVVSLEPESLLAAARRIARVSDFGPPGYERALEVLVDSAENDANLSLIGRIGMRETIVIALTNRLLKRELARHSPELFRTELIPPLIVVGLPRSGTTLLHRLLALAPDARSLAYWELRKPLPEPGRDRRLKWALAQERAVKSLAPGLDAKHYSGARSPEECFYLLDPSLVSINFWVVAPVYRYLRWYLGQDQTEPYRMYADYLRLFQARSPGQRLTLKAPIHTAHVLALRQAVPNAKIVQLHRDPAPVLASFNSLFYTLYRVVTDRVDLRRLGQENLELLAQGMKRHLATRDALPGDAIVDVYYDDLVRDPLATVRSVCEQIGLSFSPQLEARLRAFVAENPRHKHGAHRYRSQDFGLNDDLVRARFRDYIERFPRVLGGG